MLVAVRLRCVACRYLNTVLLKIAVPTGESAAAG
jgi:hypothetical protein